MRIRSLKFREAVRLCCLNGHSLLPAHQLLAGTTIAAGLVDSMPSHRCLIHLISAPVG